MQPRLTSGRVAGNLVGVLLTLTAGCSIPAPPDEGSRRSGAEVGEGPGGRRQPLALNPRQELAVGRRAYDEVMQEYRDRTLPKDSPQVTRAWAIVRRLARSAEIEPLQREINLRVRGYRFEWELNVVRDRQVNAFCLPAGKMVLLTGILEIAGGSDDFLATVLSHEMAHALAHHASEKVGRARSRDGILRSLAYGRMQEAEADHIGIFLMAFADFDPRKAPVFWERMAAAKGGKGGLPEFLSDHPTEESRIRSLRGWAPMAIKAKEAFQQGRVAPPGGGRR